jgi:glycogen operon protein
MQNTRIDNQPTHVYKEYRLRIGQPLPFGATVTSHGVNFAIFSRFATSCTLVLYLKNEKDPFVEIPFPEEFRIGHVFTMIVFDLDYERIEYGFRMDGPNKPHMGHRFHPQNVLSDPYAKSIGGREIWGDVTNPEFDYQHRAQIIPEDYDWGNDRPPNIPMEDLVIYEMHVRGFTKNPNSNAKYGGTYAAIREKIPYFVELGINCIELLPIFEFDELEYVRRNPVTKERLMNYWGYSTIGFFAPKSGYAATGVYGMHCDELKTLVKELHRNGIEVILDVVYNHTAEGNEKGPAISFRGIDNKTYYMLDPDGRYLNFSGTGNTMNCNNPVVRNMVVDSLRYWAAEYHIDGFRFDLASILGRDQLGRPLANPPLLEMLAYDPILANCKLIAEAWDAGGMYQVGSFPAYGRWAEWNGKYRDSIRRFLKSDRGLAWEISERVQGSPDLYAGRGATASVNFITAHDGFTLYDLYAYNDKHNLQNGEDNRDGANDNYSWNCGVEGETDDEEINQLRRRLIKNALATLMMSKGVPMLLMGDEMGRTQFGNNNMYCHDNITNWLDWSLLKKNEDIFTFCKYCIQFRHQHPVLRGANHFQHRDMVGSGYPDISFHGTRAWQPDWSSYVLTMAFMLDGAHTVTYGHAPDDMIYMAFNMHWDSHIFQLPQLPANKNWHVFINTSPGVENIIHPPGAEILIKPQDHIWVGGRSVVVLVGK